MPRSHPLLLLSVLLSGCPGVGGTTEGAAAILDTLLARCTP